MKYPASQHATPYKKLTCLFEHCSANMPGMDTQHQMPDQKLTNYIQKRILPALGAQGRKFTLELISPGSRNTIWFLNLENGGSYVLKAISKRFRIKNIIHAHAYLERRGIPIPKLFFADRAWKTARHMGCYFACEERVEGTPLDELGQARTDTLAQSAALFAGMHAAHSFLWGKIKSIQVFGFSTYLMRKTSERVQALAEAGCTVGSRSAGEMLSWFERKKSVIRPLTGFNLCHGDVNMKNILLCPDGKIRLIDTEAFKFLPFQIEYFRLLYALCGFDGRLQQQFKDAYLAAASHKKQRGLERCGYFYHGYVLLEIAWHFNKQLKQEGLPESVRAACTESRGRALEHLAEIVSRNS